MNITYIIGTVAAFAVMIIGMMQGGSGGFITVSQLGNFIDPASVFIVIGCTFAVLIASFPISALTAVPKHFAVIMNAKRYDPMAIIDKLVELAQIARKSGLLALEEKGNQESDPFFKQCIMLIVDNNDADQAKEIMMNDIELWDDERLTTWFDEHIPTLDLERPEVCGPMTDSALYWVAEYDLDGFRHDACKHIPENYWRMLTRKMKQRFPDRDLWQIGETYGSPELIGSYVRSGMIDAQFDFNVYQIGRAHV